jgi:hypothetical protein
MHFIVSLSQNQQMHTIINKYKNIFSTPTYVSVHELPSSGGIYQRTVSPYRIQIHNSWFHSTSTYTCHNLKCLDE